MAGYVMTAGKKDARRLTAENALAAGCNVGKTVRTAAVRAAGVAASTCRRRPYSVRGRMGVRTSFGADASADGKRGAAVSGTEKGWIFAEATQQAGHEKFGTVWQRQAPIYR